jgi:hypothetical protein
LGFYDLTSNKLLWKQPFNFSSQEIRALSEGVLTRHKITDRTVLYDRENGLIRWIANLYPVYISDSLGIMMGYKGGLYSRTLCGIDLKRGGNVWKMKLSHEYGWNEIRPLEHGTNLVVADALHKINVINGAIQTYDAQTGVRDVKAILLAPSSYRYVNGSTAAISGNGSYGYVPTDKKVISGLVSNILVEDSCYFWANRDHIACLDTTLNVIWQTPITEVKAGVSNIFRENDKLYLVNYGYGIADARRKYGRPFIACYDAGSGKELFFNRLSTKKDMIEDALRTDEAIFLLFDDGMAYQSYTDSIVRITPWNTREHGKLQGLLPPYCYVANEDTTAFELLVPELGNCLVYNDRNEVFRINTDLTISTSYQADHVYTPSFTLQDYLCIINRWNGDVRFVHQTGMPVAHLTIPFRMGRVAGNKLILLNEWNRLIILDLDEAL